MNDDVLNKILEELRQANQFTRKMARVYSIVLVIFMIVAIMVPLGLRKINMKAYQQHSEEKVSWGRVQTLIDQAEYDKAIEITQALLKRNPNYWYGHSYLGTIYQAMGDLERAESNFAKAYDLYPDVENEKVLKAIRRARDAQRRKSN